MKKVRFIEKQIISSLKKQESGIFFKNLASGKSVSEVTIYNCKAKYGGMEHHELKRIKELKEANTRLKCIVANLTLEKDAVKNILEKSSAA